ncbi:acetyltransferase, ribosomal protein N-acetylase [Halovivax ruber XH-70]|uniref:Acetyltransferase, ribosomal protein N-acetylase n=1 Tax=Halovivax ruber (strain DSM 18193 / JCM 13892 / XH-70) TaxID=797302 RepID=L0I9M1_HALRX|nr:GNAT family protein [Halovivax ruber]AGB14931.1 acetyltransferase, ribosomal protein N-acetylase [Halovivax ruber XH-70]
MFPERIETERLRLDRISHDTVDVFALHEFYSDGADVDEMFEYWDSSPHETVKETHDYVDEAERSWDEGDGAKYVIRPTDGEDGAGVIAGTTGLYPHWDKRLANLGIILGTRFWGRGYAGERADAILAVAFDRLDLELVVAAHIDGNEKSRKAIETYVDRYDGRYEGRLRNWLPLADTVADVHRYTISRDEYVAATDR